MRLFDTWPGRATAFWLVAFNLDRECLEQVREAIDTVLAALAAGRLGVQAALHSNHGQWIMSWWRS